MHLLLISGSTRHASTNTAALRTAIDMLPAEHSAALFDGLTQLPAFNPDDDRDPLPPAAADLRRQIAEADGVVVCTPEYAGALPGSFKNLLDWTVGGGEIYRKPVAWLHVAAEGRGENAHASLVTVLGYVGADIIEPACLRLPVARQVVGEDGTITDPELRSRIADGLRVFAAEIERRPQGDE